MRFQNQFAALITPEWRKAYLDYAALLQIAVELKAEVKSKRQRSKTLRASITGTTPSAVETQQYTSRLEAKWNEEVSKVNKFFASKENEYEQVHAKLTQEYETWKKDTVTKKLTWQKLKGALQEHYRYVHLAINNLELYACWKIMGH